MRFASEAVDERDLDFLFVLDVAVPEPPLVEALQRLHLYGGDGLVPGHADELAAELPVFGDVFEMLVEDACGAPAGSGVLRAQGAADRGHRLRARLGLAGGDLAQRPRRGALNDLAGVAEAARQWVDGARVGKASQGDCSLVAHENVLGI